ncbi:hypothetical protein MGU_08171 [Metarhizium guizhouense ARSEF 977]|uniref:Uncharacterized protein n=1 Tax=Metarhizium guizhouense (strain ARSEF 977) TaxID=1276136 RepID=A0A0B4H4D9_METGA|nr:hypothetical protein MGU_08171 [Metarhizium guizhouense ARSEF 977]
MRWKLFKAATLAALVQSASAAPSTHKEAKLKIVKTTTEDGITVDWREQIEAFGRKVAVRPQAQGPDGTIPIAGAGNDVPMKQPAPLHIEDSSNATELHVRARMTNEHWYATAYQNNETLGGGGFISTHPQITVEAGWTYYSVLHKGGSILFAFYTTNGRIYPGMPISALSVEGGKQEEIEIIFNLHDNCWWLYTMGRYVG